jgi:hypothetical protein
VLNSKAASIVPALAAIASDMPAARMKAFFVVLKSLEMFMAFFPECFLSDDHGSRQARAGSNKLF